MTGMMPTGPSASLSSTSRSLTSPTPVADDVPTPPAAQVITGTVDPLAAGGPRCYLGLYSCEVYNFSLASSGGVDVALAWEGGDRDMLVQLYRADVGLIHEDVAPRGGASRITFRRPDLTAMDYQLRVVSLQKDAAIPFTLTYTQFVN